jgi:hypothetical protein
LVGFSLEVTNLQISSSVFLFSSLSNGPLCCSDFQYDYPLYLLLSIIHFTRNSSTANMPVTTDAVVDEDVSGDCYHEGLTYVFDDVDPTDQDRLDYIEDVFEGSSDRVTPWKSLPSFSGSINVNGAENRLLESMKRCIEPCMQSAASLIKKPVESLTETDFASTYLNRDWYFLLLDYINDRMEHLHDRATPKEIFEMQRVWMLQCLYGTTAATLFDDPSDWYAPVRRLDLSHERYSFLFRILGADLPEITVNVSVDDGEQDVIPDVWGSFNQHNDVVSKLEQHVGNIGKRFLFENLTDVTIDDDKLATPANLLATMASNVPVSVAVVVGQS